jgi:hypothetical protein
MRDDTRVRTTLDIDDDVLQAAKELADLRRSTAGKVLSELARQGLQQAVGTNAAIRNGVPLMPRQAPGTGKLTMERVNRLRDEGL